MPTQNIRTLPAGEPPNPATTCHAEKTFHHFCGHIITTYTQHSPLCSASQNQDTSRPGSSGSNSGSGSGSTRPRSSTLTETLTRTVSQSAASAASAASAVEALTSLARRLSVQSPTPREIHITSLEFSFAARVPCLQVVDEPLYDPAPCKRCAGVMGLGEGENAEGERVLTEREEDDWVRRRAKVEADMREWVVKMNDWDGGVRVLRRDVD